MRLGPANSDRNASGMPRDFPEARRNGVREHAFRKGKKMISIGIIANPAAGKDIRRLVSYATIIDNCEKVNIVKRIVLAAQAMGVERVYMMPDTFCIAERVRSDLCLEGVLAAEIVTLDMKLNASAVDSTTAAEDMRNLGVGCIVVLGGDGTSRAVAKSIDEVPLLPISTGTNNVYPMLLEGTAAGMAAGVVAVMDEPYECCMRDKRIEVAVNDGPADIALIDAVVAEIAYVGAKAIWDLSTIRRIMVSRCSPANIGFSSIAGCLEIIHDHDAHGMALQLSDKGKRVRAPVAAGIISELHVREHHLVQLDEPFVFTADFSGTVALDGERETQFREGDEISLTLRRNGPWRVDVHIALANALSLGLFN